MAGEKSIPLNVYTHEIIVQSTDIDAMGHVNNVVYLKWVQDAAEAHWNALASDELKSKYSWVVLRHEIDYLSPAFEGQVILASTWVESYHGVKSDRIVQLKLKDTEKLLAKARTTWCLLDARTFRPKRVESDLVSVFLPDQI